MLGIYLGTVIHVAVVLIVFLGAIHEAVTGLRRHLEVLR